MLDVVCDLSHFNSVSDFSAARAAGLLAMIHKATEGLTFVDPMLNVHRDAARAADLMTGAYHFGTGGDGVAQAAYFLTQVGLGDLMALDFEPNPSGPDMTLDQAADFVEHVKAETGVYPLLYGGSSLKAPGLTIPPALRACPLWLAQYGPTAVLPPGWTAWSLWQFSDGHTNAPAAEWPGIGPCDRDRWNGDEASLRSFWAEHSLGAAA